MQPEVRDRLLGINRAFYQSLAATFAASRSRPQPGVVRVLRAIDLEASILDLGCGHGLAAAQLARNGHRGRYLGIDASEELIGLARRLVEVPWAAFAVADLAGETWPAEAAPTDGVDWILAFAFLHHIPGAALRLAVGRKIRGALREGGRAAISVWDFAGHERFRDRIIGWSEVGLAQDQVEPGDALLDWRQGGRGLRYVHHFTSDELKELTGAVGLHVEDEFHSDGRGGRLGFYQIWRA